jgi:TolB protein
MKTWLNLTVARNRLATTCGLCWVVVSGLMMSRAMAQSPAVPGLIFSSERTGILQLWRASLENPESLTQFPTDGESRGPDWSKHGWIAYQTGPSGFRTIHTIKADGTQDLQLTAGDSDAIDPAWSPDGRFIAYSLLVDGDYDLYIHKVGDPATTDDDEDYALIATTAQELRPVWSPDCTKIALVSTLNGGDAEIGVATLAPDPDFPGRFLAVELALLTVNDVIDFDPTWSPDGQFLAFSSTRSGASDIYRMSATDGEFDTNQFVRLTTHAAADRNPAWSPDGTKIAFVSERDGNREIYLMSAGLGETDTNNLKKITNEPGRDDDPAWEPDTALRITSAQIEGGQFKFRFLALPATPYTAHYRDESGSDTWHILQTIVGGGVACEVEISDPVSPTPGQRFYRVSSP